MDYIINANSAFSQLQKEVLTSASLVTENVFNEKVFALKHKCFTCVQRCVSKCKDRHLFSGRSLSLIFNFSNLNTPLKHHL